MHNRIVPIHKRVLLHRHGQQITPKIFRSGFIDASHAKRSDRDVVMEHDPVLGEDLAVERAKDKGKARAETNDRDNVVENDPASDEDLAAEKAKSKAKISDRDSVTPATKAAVGRKFQRECPRFQSLFAIKLIKIERVQPV